MKILSIKKLFKETKMIDNGLDSREAKILAKRLNIDFSKEKFSFSEWLDGINHELEHKDTVNDSPGTVANIALDHLREDPEYYTKLSKIEN